MNTPTINHEPSLLVDPGAGVLLEAPGTAVVSRRWAERHPFVEVLPPAAGCGNGYLIAGPDAKKVAGGAGGTEYVGYRIVREVAGALHLTREL